MNSSNGAEPVENWNMPSTLLTIHDETSSGQKTHSFTLECLTERMTVRELIRARIYQAERDRVDAERSAQRKSQVGTGDRSERIRTYNFPQGRVSDHRINLTLYKLDQIIEGPALEELIEALMRDHQAELLAADAA